MTDARTQASWDMLVAAGRYEDAEWFLPGSTSLGLDQVVTYDEVARWLPREIVAEIEDALGWQTEHGTVAGYQRERRRGGVACRRCLLAARLAMRNGSYDGND